MDERELLQGCIAKDEQAWKHFIKSYDRCIYGAILNLLTKFSIHESEIADDIFASVIEKLLVNDCAALRRFKWNSKLSTWLVSVARNRTYDYLRDLKRKPSISLEAPIDEDSKLENIISDDLDLDHQMEVRLTASEALEMVPDKDRLILKLYYLEGMKEKEIGELVGLSVDAVSARKSRAINKLRAIVRKRA